MGCEFDDFCDLGWIGVLIFVISVIWVEFCCDFCDFALILVVILVLSVIWGRFGFRNNKLNRIQSIGSFLRTKGGYRVTNPEGYVAIKKGSAVKLVDRLEFSVQNFTAAKNWDKK